MNARRRGGAGAALLRLYRLALRLYPAAFQSVYAEEMQAVFRLCLEEAARRGVAALLLLAWKEVRTLPSSVVTAHAQARTQLRAQDAPSSWLENLHRWLERGSNMSIRSFLPRSSGPVSWPVAIFSLIPFLLAGPGIQVINYHPGWDPQELPWIAAVYAPLTVGLLVLGFFIGLLRKFPRWVYLYSLYVLFLLVFGTTFLLYGRPWTINDDWLILLLWIVLSILAIYWLPPLRPYLVNIRQDWTLLSYAMFGSTLFILAMHDMDVHPAYDLELLLPSLIAWLGALASLRMADPLKRVGALLGSMLIGALVWTLPFFTGGSLAEVRPAAKLLLELWLVLGALILAPVLVNVSFPRRQAAKG